MTSKSPQTYLQRLKFKKEDRQKLSAKYLQNIRLMVILVLAALIIGLFSFANTPRTLNPEVKIPFIIVSTALPGASPQEVESLITIPLEKEIKNIKGVDVFRSSSRESVSVITIEFTAATPTTEARNRVQSAIDKVKDLPEDALASLVQELDFENFPVITFALVKKEGAEDYASLMKLAAQLEEILEEIKSVDRVEISGLEQREIQILIQPEIIREKGVNPFLLSQAIHQKLKSYPAGRVQTPNSSFSLTIDQPLTTLADLRDLNISFNNQSFLLGEISLISEQTQADQAKSFYHQPGKEVKRTVVFDVFKTTTAELDETGLNVRQKTVEFMKGYQADYQVEMITDYAEEIDQQFSDLKKNFSQTLFLVFASMLLLYGVKQALIAASAIPLALLLVFTSMQVFDISLSFVSIFALLIALGLFVDNAVVIIEAYTSYFRTGKFTPWQTAILVWKDYFIELFSINLLTVWAFLPLLVTSGIIGEFIFPIPIIVSVAMIGSAGVAILFTLPSMMILSQLKAPKRVKVLILVLGLIGLAGLVISFVPKTFLFLPTLIIILFLLFLSWYFRKQLLEDFRNKVCGQCFYKHLLSFLGRAFNQGFISLEPLSRRYRQVVIRLMDRRSARVKVFFIILSFTLFSYLLLPLGLVENEFFPRSDQELLSIQLELPSGTNQETTTQAGKELLSQINEEEIDFIVLEVGKKADAGFAISAPGDNNALFILSLKDKGGRRKTSIALAQELRTKLANYDQGEIQVVEESGGPPAGADVQINLLGEELEQLEAYAQKIEDYLQSQEGTTNINRSIKKGTSKLVFQPDKEALIQYGLSEEEIGFWLRTLASGFKIDELEIDNQDLEIVLKMEKDLISPARIGSLQIPSSSGYLPLNELGSLVLKPNPSLVTRENGKRTISVTAAVLPGFQAPAINKNLENFVNQEVDFASGYSWDTGGANEENQQSIQSILQAMVISLVLIGATMVIQLGSFRKAFIVVLVIPLAVSGVFILFALTGTPLSFPALVGLLALFGIVIANSLMVVDKINKNLQIGLKLKEAIVDAAASRLEPILLTTASQIIGLVPITLSDPLWQGMGGAIISGMSFSGIIMLLFIPIVYFYLFR